MAATELAPRGLALAFDPAIRESALDCPLRVLSCKLIVSRRLSICWCVALL